MYKIFSQKTIFQVIQLITLVAWVATISKSKNLLQSNITNVNEEDCNPYCVGSANQLYLSGPLTFAPLLGYRIF